MNTYEFRIKNMLTISLLCSDDYAVSLGQAKPFWAKFAQNGFVLSAKSLSTSCQSLVVSRQLKTIANNRKSDICNGFCATEIMQAAFCQPLTATTPGQSRG
ncbi:MAG: hypothetical protein MUD08_10560 [Cytophagales bacterium]|nr:hypothetical protein [Cytophagales bacterium]